MREYEKNLLTHNDPVLLDQIQFMEGKQVALVAGFVAPFGSDHCLLGPKTKDPCIFYRVSEVLGTEKRITKMISEKSVDFRLFYGNDHSYSVGMENVMQLMRLKKTEYTEGVRRFFEEGIY